MAAATKKEDAYPWKAGASSGHTTNLKQSILRLSISMVSRIHRQPRIQRLLIGTARLLALVEYL